ncbi:hypothetical protein RSOL_429850 [Rhizoctonia solani AG-3 Rhs1AP]|uniref:Uncharacterized protein n=1 Tax=Rhizoctonia solani AG-3 Rhs1AP TaxID=1086054 RepID=X8JLH9_9AGAM|nr:hypothetical protein RSOL_429850 [Rhizoctonia solani AG-3 Rhs1AP]
MPWPPPFARPVGYATPNPHLNPPYMAHPPPYVPRPLPYAYNMPYASPVSAHRPSHPHAYPQPGSLHTHPTQLAGALTTHKHAGGPLGYTHTPQTPTSGTHQHMHSPDNTYRIPAPQFQPMFHPPPGPRPPYWFQPHPPGPPGQ